MVELGQLERRHEDFTRRNVLVLVVSLEGEDDAAKTQAQFQHLKVVADADHRLIDAAGVLHLGANPHGGDAAAPTTILIDRHGVVQWLFRPDRVITRLSPDEVLEAVDRHLP
jgi:alkyl hydroperoxide reductase subunit AhpC